MRLLALTGVAAGMLASPLAWAQDAPPAPASFGPLQITDGASYVANCNPQPNDPNRNARLVLCTAYAAGATDTLMSINAASKSQNLFCPTNEASYAKVRDGAVTFVRENPNVAKMNAGLVFVMMMPVMFPCKK